MLLCGTPCPGGGGNILVSHIERCAQTILLCMSCYFPHRMYSSYVLCPGCGHLDDKKRQNLWGNKHKRMIYNIPGFIRCCVLIVFRECSGYLALISSATIRISCRLVKHEKILNTFVKKSNAAPACGAVFQPGLRSAEPRYVAGGRPRLGVRPLQRKL